MSGSACKIFIELRNYNSARFFGTGDQGYQVFQERLPLSATAIDRKLGIETVMSESMLYRSYCADNTAFPIRLHKFYSIAYQHMRCVYPGEALDSSRYGHGLRELIGIGVHVGKRSSVRQVHI